MLYFGKDFLCILGRMVGRLVLLYTPVAVLGLDSGWENLVCRNWMCADSIACIGCIGIVCITLSYLG